MFAGGEVTWHGELRVGETVRRASRVESVTEKHGRSGRLVVVVVGTQLYRDNGALAVVKRQDLIYREAEKATAAPEPDAAAALQPVGSPFHRVSERTLDFATDPTVLMRFSAATATPTGSTTTGRTRRGSRDTPAWSSTARSSPSPWPRCAG